MRTVKRLSVVVVCFAQLTATQGNTFDKVRNNGGSVSKSVKPDDWDNKLTVASDVITLVLKDGQSVTI